MAVELGLPEDLGPAIAGLPSEDFGWVNAQGIEVAGGRTHLIAGGRAMTLWR
jgi:hypothetical protein